MSTTTTDAFGAKVEEYRERLGLLQKELAGKVGLSPSHLNRIEKGTRKRPGVETVRRMIKALRLTQSEAKELVKLAKLSTLVLQNNFKEKKDAKGAKRNKDAGAEESGGGQPASPGAGAFGSGVSLGAILPRFRPGQQQTDIASQQLDRTIGILVEQTFDEFQLTPEKRVLAERLVLENVRSVCQVLAKEQGQ